jgi:hypothetical protein
VSGAAEDNEWQPRFRAEREIRDWRLPGRQTVQIESPFFPSWIGLMVPGEVVLLNLSLRDVDFSQLLFQG